MKDLYRIGFQPYVQYEMILEFMRHWFQNLSGDAQGVIVPVEAQQDTVVVRELKAREHIGGCSSGREQRRLEKIKFWES